MCGAKMFQASWPTWEKTLSSNLGWIAGRSKLFPAQSAVYHTSGSCGQDNNVRQPASQWLVRHISGSCGQDNEVRQPASQWLVRHTSGSCGQDNDVRQPASQWLVRHISGSYSQDNDVRQPASQWLVRNTSVSCGQDNDILMTNLQQIWTTVWHRNGWFSFSMFGCDQHVVYVPRPNIGFEKW